MIKKRDQCSACFRIREYVMYFLKTERISAVSKDKLKLFDIKWKDWKKYISMNIIIYYILTIGYRHYLYKVSTQICICEPGVYISV